MVAPPAKVSAAGRKLPSSRRMGRIGRQRRLLGGAASFVAGLFAVTAVTVGNPARAWGATTTSRPWGHVNLPPGLPVVRTRPATRLPRVASAAGPAFSPNWAGKVATGGVFTGVSGNWTVPSVVASQTMESSATWIGIDGTAAPTLIQT